MDKNRVIVLIYRSDIQYYEDVIEEYFRFYGYNNFKLEVLKLELYKVVYLVDNKNIFQLLGYNEIRIFSLIFFEMNIFNFFNFESIVKLMIFVFKEREEVRNFIILLLLEFVEFNLKRKINNVLLFEYGMINDNKFVYGLLLNEKLFDEIK